MILAVDLAQKHKELGEAPIGRLLWKFSLPGIVGMLVNSLYNIVDRIFIGNGVNSEAIGGLTVAFPLMIITMAVSMLVGVGASTLLSIRLGEHEHEAAEKLLGNGFILLIIFGLLPTVVGLPLLEPMLVLFGATPDILGYAVDYTRIILIGNVGASVGFGMNNFVRAEGSPRMAMVAMLISALLNIVLDYIFIFPLGMGVAGAAVATVIAQGVSVVLCILYVMARVRILIPGRKHLDVGRKLYWDLFSQSISMGLMSSIVSAGSVILQYGINGLGTLTIAGHTAARKLFAFTDMPLIAMANAASTFVSQNYGAGQPERIRKGMREIYLYSLVVMVVTVLLMQVSAEWLVRMVSGSSEALVLENGARYLRWTSPFYAVLGVLLSTRYALQSLGEKVLPLFSSVIEFLGKVVFVLVFIPRFAYNAVILCEPVVWCFMALYLVAVYRCNPFVFPKKQ